jgi:adhesin HecA-like repeat protein
MLPVSVRTSTVADVLGGRGDCEPIGLELVGDRDPERQGVALARIEKRRHHDAIGFAFRCVPGLPQEEPVNGVPLLRLAQWHLVLPEAAADLDNRGTLSSGGDLELVAGGQHRHGLCRLRGRGDHGVTGWAAAGGLGDIPESGQPSGPVLPAAYSTSGTRSSRQAWRTGSMIRQVWAAMSPRTERI